LKLRHLDVKIGWMYFYQNDASGDSKMHDEISETKGSWPWNTEETYNNESNESHYTISIIVNIKAVPPPAKIQDCKRDISVVELIFYSPRTLCKMNACIL